LRQVEARAAVSRLVLPPAISNINIIERFEMCQTDYEPTDTAAVLTTGAIGKLAAATADLRAGNGNILAKIANYETQFNAVLADLEKRIDAQAHKVRQLIADAERRESYLPDRDGRPRPRPAKRTGPAPPKPRQTGARRRG
jgi:hypothetical protein